MKRTALITILLIVLANLAFAQLAVTNTSVKAVIGEGPSQDYDCPTNYIKQDGTCKKCADGWFAINETSCEWSTECLEGRVWDGDSCVPQHSNSEVVVKCKPGSHPEKVENVNVTMINDSDWFMEPDIFANKNNTICVPDEGYFEVDRGLLIIAWLIGISIIIWGVYDYFKNRKKKKEEENGEEQGSSN